MVRWLQPSVENMPYSQGMQFRQPLRPKSQLLHLTNAAANSAVRRGSSPKDSLPRPQRGSRTRFITGAKQLLILQMDSNEWVEMHGFEHQGVPCNGRSPAGCYHSKHNGSCSARAYHATTATYIAQPSLSSARVTGKPGSFPGALALPLRLVADSSQLSANGGGNPPHQPLVKGGSQRNRLHGTHATGRVRKGASTRNQLGSTPGRL